MKDLVDMFQIGARNMQNFELLKKVGSIGKPVLLKRGPSATIQEWFLSAEYLMANGTRDVVLCERGIRTFETYTRNTLDISAIPVAKELTHLPVVVDPSHALGIRSKVAPAALAAIAAGADGITVEVHPNPDVALSDGPQSLYPEQFEKLMRDIEALSPVVGKELLRTPHTVRVTKADEAAQPGAPSGQAAGTAPIAYCGTPGAFAEQALNRVFGEEAPRKGLPSFSAIFDALLDGSASFGVVPVENSQTGSIHEHYDLFLRYPDVAIVGELKLRIVHCLIADNHASIDDIHIVRSHPQGFEQCSAFLAKHPDWSLEPTASTATAVSGIAREGSLHVAAIAGEAAARVNGLKILHEGIEDNPMNYTRFVIAAKRGPDGTAPVPPGMDGKAPDKTTMVFSVPDEPGSLFACLKIMADRGLNMSKLESRPIQGKPWEYLFYVDLTIPEGSDLNEMFEALKPHTREFHHLGTYRASL
jgi:3-deoxy-7-phosphoheptulonate synthase